MVQCVRSCVAQLGQSTIALTSDTYSHMLEGVGRDAAERAAALVPRAPKAASASVCDQSVTNGAPGTTKGLRQNDEGPGIMGTPLGTRTPNPLIKSPGDSTPGSPR